MRLLERRSRHRRYFRSADYYLLRDIVVTVPTAWPIIEGINNCILAGDLYQALKEAKKIGATNIAASTEAGNFKEIPAQADLRLFARFGEFPCILEKMLKRELQEEPIAEGRRGRDGVG